jgi:hypothetical protein
MDVFVTPRNAIISHFLMVYFWGIGLSVYLIKDPSWFLSFSVMGMLLNFWSHTSFVFHSKSLVQRLISLIFITPYEHHWHHSRNQSYCNFGTVLSIWDRLHGTFYQEDRLPSQYGEDDPKTIWNQLIWPFTKLFIPICIGYTSLVSQADLIGVAQLKGGVPHSPVKDQLQAEMCWSYSLMSFLEGEQIRKTGRYIELSPLYLGFYHLYHQVEYRMSEYARRPQRQATALEPGNQISTLLDESSEYGVVPERVFSAAVRTDHQRERLEESSVDILKKLKVLLHQGRLNLDESDDGVNDQIYSEMVMNYKPVLKYAPPRPNQRLSMGPLGQYTPREFMLEYLGFNPKDYTHVSVYQKYHSIGIEVVRKLLQSHYAVPLGFSVMDGVVQGVSAFEKFVDTGFVTDEYCPQYGCKKLVGGHQVLIVNWLEDATGEVTGFIVKNSWGKDSGLNINGRQAGEGRRGYYVISADYLKKYSVSRGGWDVMIPKSLAKRYPELKEYHSKLPSYITRDGKVH